MHNSDCQRKDFLMVLLYSGNDRYKIDVLSRILDEMNIEYSYIDDSHFDSSLKELSQNNNLSSPSLGSKQPFVFLDDLSRESIEQIEQELRKQNISIPHKAAATPTNLEWKFVDLISEVEAEAENFMYRDLVYESIMNADKERLKKDPKYLQLMSMAYTALEKSAPTEILKQIAAMMESLK